MLNSNCDGSMKKERTKDVLKQIKRLLEISDEFIHHYEQHKG